MNDKNIEEEIRECLQAEVQQAEPNREWWSRVFSSLSRQKPRSFWSWLTPKTRLAWVLIPLVILLIGGTVYAATTGVKKLFEGWASDVEKQGLSTSLNLSQTIDGITVNLERGYADSNVVLVGWSVASPEGQQVPLGGLLTMANGQKLNGMIALIGNQEEAENLGFDNRQTIFSYDASGITGSPSELNLTLKVSRMILSGIEEEQKPVGPFVFNFTLPFHPAKVIDINETIEVSGIPITLEKVVISPWATRVDFGYESPESDIFKYETHGSPLLSLSLPDGSSKYMSMGRDRGTPSASYIMGDFSDKSGDWTLKINELKLESGQSVGPWVFRFQVP